MRLFGNNPRYERWRWQILTITWLAYGGFYLMRKSFAVAKVEMGEGTAIGLSAHLADGVDRRAYLTAYAIGQFVWGVCGVKWARVGWFW